MLLKKLTMPTTKNRINLTVPAALCDALSDLAERDNVRVSTKALSLLEDAIEREEDALWVERATERMKKHGKAKTHTEMMRRYA